MAFYILRRFIYLIPTLFAVSILSFVIIQLPPGDFLTSYAAQLRQQGDIIDEVQLEALRQRYGFGEPVYVQYIKWVNGIITRGDWGQSFEWQKPVKDLIWERVWLTVAVSLSALLVSWFVAIPIGVYSATHQYSWLDYLLTTLSFIGLGTPGFLLALVVLFVVQSQLGINVSGLFRNSICSRPGAGPSLWICCRAFGAHGDRRPQQHSGEHPHYARQFARRVKQTLCRNRRAKGVNETKLIWKYPVRVALNPFFSTVGWSLAGLVSGATLVSLVLSLQTTGPMLLRALTSQDMYLAGSILFLLSALTMIGTLISDILLAIVDPRIRLEN
jgi:peptide/nickel transport system permease protein